MKLAIANKCRARYLEAIYNLLEEHGEDVGYIESNKLNLPVVEDGEEGVMVVTVSILKSGEDDYVSAREQYSDKLRERAERKAKADAKKKEKEEKEGKQPSPPIQTSNV